MSEKETLVCCQRIGKRGAGKSFRDAPWPTVGSPRAAECRPSIDGLRSRRDASRLMPLRRRRGPGSNSPWGLHRHTTRREARRLARNPAGARITRCCEAPARIIQTVPLPESVSLHAARRFVIFCRVRVGVGIADSCHSSHVRCHSSLLFGGRREPGADH